MAEPLLRQALSRPSSLFDRPAKEKPNSAATASIDELDQMRFRLIVNGIAEVLSGLNVDPAEAVIAFDEARARHQPPVTLRCQKCHVEFATNAAAARKPSLCRDCRNDSIREQGTRHQANRRATAEAVPRPPRPDRRFVPRINTGPCPTCGEPTRPDRTYCSKSCSDNRFRRKIRQEVTGEYRQPVQ
jgi:hypothetical protein